MFITLALSLSELALLSTRLGCDGLTSQVPSRLALKCACGTLSCHKSTHDLVCHVYDMSATVACLTTLTELSEFLFVSLP